MAISVPFTATLPIKIVKKPRWYLASCPVLDVHTQGETEKAAKQALAEALSLFFMSCYERGTLDAVLKQCGFKSDRDRFVGPAKRRPNQEWLNVPIPFVVDQTAATCRA